ncbi:MAG TPA: ribbon-helix-helix protein, CopG family [Alphaproteobacteria bacterium]|nr:ribbon-helix-helix protein, CopG family [Alphaproteobacteria bacterium]
MTTTQGVKLDEQTQKRLKALGKARDRSPHWLMRTAIEDYLDREEKYEREKREDMKRWENYQLTGKAIPHEAVVKWLDALAEGKPAKRPR